MRWRWLLLVSWLLRTEHGYWRRLWAVHAEVVVVVDDRSISDAHGVASTKRWLADIVVVEVDVESLEVVLFVAAAIVERLIVVVVAVVLFRCGVEGLCGRGGRVEV